MKRKLQRTMGIALAASMALSAVSASAAGQTSDLNGHWAEAAMTDFITKGYVNGYAPNQYAPNDGMTRAQCMAIINRIAGLTEQSDKVSQYLDVEESEWYYQDVAKALAAGYVDGTSPTTMEPEATITRQEAMAMLARLIGAMEEDPSVLNAFSDKSAVADWALDEVSGLVAGKYVLGSDEGKLNPTSALTRAEGVTMMGRMETELKNALQPEETLIYGTMNIPYNVFYGAQGVDYAVDAVTSATSSKWQNANLVAGTYQEAQETGGKILGVTYPVAVTQSVLDAMGDNQYGFVPLEDQTAVPAAYQTVTLDENGQVTFSAVQAQTTALTGVTATLTTQTSYGDYQIDVDALNNNQGTSDIGTIYGVLVQTSDGKSYAMRHLENIWKDEIAWSVGFVTTTHGNTLSYENYADMMGKTISQLTFITEQGVYTLETELYVPVKFEGTVTVDSAAITTGTTAVNVTGLPADYQAVYTVSGQEGWTVTNGRLSFSNAQPGSYTLTVSDSSGKYAPLSTSFVLTTATMPAAYNGTVTAPALTTAAGMTAEELSNFLSNISSVSVNGTAYSASGKRGVKVIAADGTVDLSTTPFTLAGVDGKYVLEVTATGYTQTLTFELPEYLYATATLSYDEFYAGDVTSTEGFDAVASATTQKSTIFTNTNASTPDDNGYTIDGVKNVSVAVPIASYAALAERLVLNENPAQAVKQYKLLTADGASASTLDVKATVTDATTELVTGGHWGDYQINVTETSTSYIRNSREDTFAINSGIQGIILETATGLKVGMAHMENIWVQPYEIAFSLADQSNSAEFAKLVGETVVKITYLMPDGAYIYELADDQQVYIPPAYTGTAITSTFGTDMTSVTLYHLPDLSTLGNAKVTVAYSYPRASGHGSESVTLLDSASLVAGQNTYALDNSVLTEEVLANNGSYSVTISCDNYCDITVDTPMTADQRTRLEALQVEAAALLTGYDAETATNAEKILKAHYDEAAALLNQTDATAAQAEELLTELPELIGTVKDTVQKMTVTVQTAPDKWLDFTAYNTDVLVTAVDGLISNIQVTNEMNRNNIGYVNQALAGVKTALVGENIANVGAMKVDAVSGATCSSEAIVSAVKTAAAEFLKTAE